MNPAIEEYISGLFTSLPKTRETTRARAELIAMSEDKYAELIASGLTDAEATGQVITEFGTLDEIAEGLGIQSALADVAADSSAELSSPALEHAERSNRRASFLIALGVLIILLPLTATTTVLRESANLWAALAFFPAVAIAVGLFISANFINRPAAAVISGQAKAGESDSARYRDLLDQQAGRFAVGLSIGIALVLFSLAFTVLAQARWGQEYAPPAFFGTVGFGVGTIIIVGMRRGFLNAAANPQRIRAQDESQKVAKQIELIAPIYWMAMVLVYLAWSFLGDAWRISWVLWPIAGIVFGILNAVQHAVFNWRQKQD